jgi:regulator of replication initiation timing
MDQNKTMDYNLQQAYAEIQRLRDLIADLNDDLDDAEQAALDLLQENEELRQQVKSLIP